MAAPTQEQSTTQVNPGNPTAVCYFPSSEVGCQYEPALAANDFTVLRARHGMHAYWLAMSANPDIIVLEGSERNDQRDYVLDRLGSHEKTSRTPVIILCEDVTNQPIDRDDVAVIKKGIAPSALIAKANALISKSIQERTDRVDAFFSTLDNAKTEASRSSSQFVRADDPAQRLVSRIRQDKQRQKSRAHSLKHGDN